MKMESLLNDEIELQSTRIKSLKCSYPIQNTHYQ